MTTLLVLTFEGAANYDRLSERQMWPWVGFDGHLWWALMVSSCTARIARARLKGTSSVIISESDPDQSVGFDG